MQNDEPIIKNAEYEILQHNNEVKFIKVNAEEANLFRDKYSDWEVLKVSSFVIVKMELKNILVMSIFQSKN